MDLRLVTALATLAATGCSTSDALRAELAAAEALAVTLPTLQTAYREVHGHYASTIQALTYGADTLAGGIRITIGGASAFGWVAAASSPAVPGAVCIAHVGDPGSRMTLRGRFESDVPNVVVCMDFEAWARTHISRPGTRRPIVAADAA